MTGQLWPDPIWAYTILSISSTSMIWVPWVHKDLHRDGSKPKPGSHQKKLLMSKMIREVWITSCPSADYKESPSPEVKQGSRYLLRSLRFGSAFSPSKNLTQKSLLLSSSAWTEQSSLRTFPKKLCYMLKTSNPGAQKPQGIFCHFK